MNVDIDILKLARANEALAVELRRHMHRYPELTGVEFKTLEYIKDRLRQFNITYTEVENGGILGFLGDEKAGKTVLLRADMDALPILENKRNLKQEKAVVSQIDGVHHACGHDAHTAMLLAAGKILKENEHRLPGRVLLLFERGEEGGGNLRYLLQYIEQQQLKIDGAHAIHVKPDLPSGRIVAKKGEISAGASGFTITITGQGGHGSRPDLSNNPIDCFVAIYEALKSIRLKYISPFERFTFSVCQVESGSKGNVIPNHLSFKGSARFYNAGVAEKFLAEFENILENTTKAYHCTYKTEGLSVGFPVINNDSVAEISQNGIKKHLGKDVLLTNTEPSMGSESFSLVAKLWPSIMVHLGIGNDEIGSGASLHNEFFDMDEGALHLGIAETVGFAAEFLNYPEEIPFASYKGTLHDLINSRYRAFKS